MSEFPVRSGENSANRITDRTKQFCNLIPFLSIRPECKPQPAGPGRRYWEKGLHLNLTKSTTSNHILIFFNVSEELLNSARDTNTDGALAVAWARSCFIESDFTDFAKAFAMLHTF